MKHNDYLSSEKICQPPTLGGVSLKGIATALELPIILFPVIVVIVVAGTFFIPNGRCAIWQWWVSVAAAIGLCFITARSFKLGVTVAIIFLLILAIIWMGCNVLMTLPNNDIDRCHGPTILMLVEGWNPIWDGDFTKIAKSLAIPIESFSAYHIIPLHKCTHYFSAASFFFTGAIFNLFAPLSFFLLIALSFAVFRFLGNIPFLFKIIAIVLSYILTPCSDMIADMAVGLSGVWLLLAMYGCLVSGRVNIVHLAISTFWMIAAKPSGVLHGIVFWAIFLIALSLKKRTCLMRSITSFFISLGLFLIVIVSPYATSWINFSHPLYPKYSSDEVRFPSKNIVNDFLDRNDDAAQMGRIGAWVNAFVSPQIARMYYNVKLGRNDFFPSGRTWNQGGNTNPNGSPTTTKTKIMFFMPIIILLCVSGKHRLENAFIVSCLIGGTILMPCELIGYVRYVPWYFMGIVFCIPTLYETTFKLISKCGLALVIMVTAFSLFPSLVLLSISIDYRNATRLFFGEITNHIMIVASQKERKPIPEDVWHSGYVILQKRNVPELRNAKVLTFPDDSPEAQTILDHWEECELFYNNSFRVKPRTDLKQYSWFRREVQVRPKGTQRMKASINFICRTLAITLPKNCWHALFG